jgi:hypothetical protein
VAAAITDFKVSLGSGCSQAGCTISFRFCHTNESSWSITRPCSRATSTSCTTRSPTSRTW